MRASLLNLPAMLRGDVREVSNGIERRGWQMALQHLVVITAGAGAFGAAMGLWRNDTQAVFTAIKLPLVLLLTTAGNALLNAIFAPLLGLNLSFRQCLLAILTSFSIAAVVLGAFSPIGFFVVWNTETKKPLLYAKVVNWSAMLEKKE